MSDKGAYQAFHDFWGDKLAVRPGRP